MSSSRAKGLKQQTVNILLQLQVASYLININIYNVTYTYGICNEREMLLVCVVTRTDVSLHLVVTLLA